MSVTIAGVVKNGVVVPSAPLPEGVSVEIHLNEGLSDHSPAADPDTRVRRNQRRIELINKELDAGLTFAEAAELEQLQAETDRYLQTHLPLPNDVLQQLQDAARREGLRNDPPGQ